ELSDQDAGATPGAGHGPGVGTEVQQVLTDATKGLITVGMTTRRACELTGYARASFYRHHRTPSPVRPEPIHQRDRDQPGALSDCERGQILDVLASDEYAQYSVGQGKSTRLNSSHDSISYAV